MDRLDEDVNSLEDYERLTHTPSDQFKRETSDTLNINDIDTLLFKAVGADIVVGDNVDSVVIDFESKKVADDDNTDSNSKKGSIM